MASFRRSLVVSVLFVVVGGPAFALIYVPYWITRFRIPSFEPSWQMLLATALILAGIMPALESMVRFITVGRGTSVPAVPTEHLVVSGVYRYVRNPMYSGIVIALTGEILLFRSPSLVCFALLFWLASHLFVFFYEEPTLSRRYGEEYLRFKRQVPRWLPRMKAQQGGGRQPGNISPANRIQSK
jgi:protein-S-isoprenylcysteine O-methyltransferase Ste14